MSSNHTLWLVAVAGPRAGEIHELAPGRPLHVPLTDAEDDVPIGPFVFDDRTVRHPLEGASLNLFDLAAAELRPGDMIEYGGTTLLVCARPPSWELPEDDGWIEQLIVAAGPDAEPFRPPTPTFDGPDLERVGRDASFELGLDPALDDFDDTERWQGAPTEPLELETLEELDLDHAEEDEARWLDPEELELHVARALGIAMLPPVALPRVFHSVYVGAPFERCLMCERELLGGETPYLIEKVYRGRETILECALCVGCATDVNSEMSEESRKRLEAFGNKVADGDAGLSSCRCCGTPRTQLPGFNILATAVGGSTPPASWTLLCTTCTEGLEKLLSKSTRDIYRDFVEDNFPGVPVDLDLPAPVFF